MSHEWIYLDYAATTPVDPIVAGVMRRYLTAEADFGNPSSLHAAGRAGNAAIEEAAGSVARLVNCDPRRLVWTSGATEADNLAILGVARARAHRGQHVITMPTEHKAVTDACKALEKAGFEVTWLPPEPSGVLDIDRLKDAIRDDTQLVSIMYVNNETGVVQDIAEIGAVCAERGVFFHVDAAQSLGKLSLDLASLPVDLVSMTAHKIYGPKGIGALYVRKRPDLNPEPMLFGGSQQGGLRPGTLPVHLVAGFGCAAEIAQESMLDDFTHLKALRDRFLRGVESLPGLRYNGDPDSSYPGIVNLSAPGLDGESLMLALEPLCVSTGSACNSQSREPSAVLRSMGRSDAEAESAVRVSFGRPTTVDEVDLAVERYRSAVTRLRDMLPDAA